MSLNDPPAGITIEKVSQADDAVAFVVRCDADDVDPGLKGNLIVTAFTKRQRPVQNGKPGGGVQVLARHPAAIPLKVIK